MIETIKKIVSEHTGISMDNLRFETPIGRSAVGNSIVLHRMYASIAKEGITIPGYQEIQTFGELVNKITGIPDTVNAVINKPEIIAGEFNLTGPMPGMGIGIDIEEIAKMPEVIDFREDEFYKMNFTPGEMAYCILQSRQYASFTGLFAAKEAIVKADNNFKKIPFNEIFIDHLPGGQPVFNGFTISISHVQHLSVAIAIKNFGHNHINLTDQTKPIIINNSRLSFFLSVIAILLALVTISIVLFK